MLLVCVCGRKTCTPAFGHEVLVLESDLIGVLATLRASLQLVEMSDPEGMSVRHVPDTVASRQRSDVRWWLREM